MITRIVLGNETELTNIEEVKEIVQDNGDYVYKGVAIDLLSMDADNSLSMTDVTEILSADKALDNIKIYKKDELNRTIDEETGDESFEYGEEYLSFESSDYPGLKSIYGDIGSGKISISLGADHTKIADNKYNELIEKNISLESQNETLIQSIAELTAIISSLYM